MKPMAEEDRKQLIAFVRIEISRWKAATDKQYMVELMEIALASLTAEPVAVLYKTGEVLTKEDCTNDKVFSVCCKVETPLYTAPPVPVIDIPDEISEDWSNENVDDLSLAQDIGYNRCLCEIKRRNGLGE